MKYWTCQFRSHDGTAVLLDEEKSDGRIIGNRIKYKSWYNV